MKFAHYALGLLAGTACLVGAFASGTIPKVVYCEARKIESHGMWENGTSAQKFSIAEYISETAGQVTIVASVKDQDDLKNPAQNYRYTVQADGVFTGEIAGSYSDQPSGTAITQPDFYIYAMATLGSKGALELADFSLNDPKHFHNSVEVNFSANDLKGCAVLPKWLAEKKLEEFQSANP